MRVNEVDRLTSIAYLQPHAAYAAFTHGLDSRWTYLSLHLTYLTSLEEAIRQRFLVCLTGQNHLGDNEMASL